MKFLLLLLAYLFGSIPMGVLVGKLFKKTDIRNYGSKNLGTTNAVRVLGKKYGILVFVLDVIKVYPILFIVKFNWFNVDNLLPFMAYALAGFLGHIFPIFLKFKGGKGVATGFGVVLIYEPITALIGIGIFFVIAFTSKYVSIGSMVGAFSALVAYCLFTIFVDKNNVHSLSNDDIKIELILYTITVAIIIFRHKANIIRLINKTENKIGDKKRKLNELNNKEETN